MKNDGIVVKSVDGDIGRIRLNRPKVHNAIDVFLVEDLIAAAIDVDSSPGVKTVIFDGCGPSFCAGFDLKQFKNSPPEELRHCVAEGFRLVQTISNMRATTIAAVHGNCIGGGMALMMACDFRYASDNTVFRLPEAGLGMPLAWGAVTWLVREVGALFTTELILSCRTLGVAEALRRGLINDVFELSELEEEVKNVAERLGRHSSFILESTKRQVGAARRQLCTEEYGFLDAHLFYSAFLDRQSECK